MSTITPTHRRHDHRLRDFVPCCLSRHSIFFRASSRHGPGPATERIRERVGLPNHRLRSLVVPFREGLLWGPNPTRLLTQRGLLTRERESFRGVFPISFDRKPGLHAQTFTAKVEGPPHRRPVMSSSVSVRELDAD